ncbi:hypothetical protein I3760_03G170400 [Carya illinoinensis]|nr:hypothetical protein I3760_03G170400 [Carya illinoinensis]
MFEVKTLSFSSPPPPPPPNPCAAQCFLILLPSSPLLDSLTLPPAHAFHEFEHLLSSSSPSRTPPLSLKPKQTIQSLTLSLSKMAPLISIWSLTLRSATHCSSALRSGKC